MSRRPDNDQGIAKELAKCPSHFYGVFVCDSLRSPDAFTTCTVLSRRSHCADAVTSQRTPYNIRANATDYIYHGVCTVTILSARGASIAL